MGWVDRVLRVLARPLQEATRKAIAEHLATAPHGADPQDLLYRHRIHGDRARLHLDPTAVVNDALFNLSGGHVTVGKYAFFGHGVSVLTGEHDINKFGRERQTAIVREGQDIVIEEGVWVASNVVVVGPCTIGAHAVVGVGSLVLDDVPSYTVAAGSPAKVLRQIDHGQDA